VEGERRIAWFTCGKCIGIQTLKPGVRPTLKLRNISVTVISETDAPRRGVEGPSGSALELIAEADGTKPAPGEATPETYRLRALRRHEPVWQFPGPRRLGDARKQGKAVGPAAVVRIVAARL